MTSYKDYVAGWIDSSISDLLNDFPPTSKKMKYCLITCIDSNIEPSSLLDTSPELVPYLAKASAVGQGIILPTKDLLDLHQESKIFFGFDEIWFFPNKITAPKPTASWIVGPSKIDDDSLNSLSSWMISNSCSLALGDGVGLNFVIKARGLVKYILAVTMKQEQR